MFIEIMFKMLLFKGGVLIYAEHCIYVCVCMHICACVYIYIHTVSCQQIRSEKDKDIYIYE